MVNFYVFVMEISLAGDRKIRLPEPDFLPKKRVMNSKVRVYEEKLNRQAYFLMLLGVNEVQMGQVFGVAEHTIKEWKNKYPLFNEAIQRGRTQADSEVANSLYQAAVGYSHPDEVILTNRVREYNEKGRVVREWTEPLRVQTTKRYPPSVGAAIKWLESRQPEIWRNSLYIEGKIRVTNQIDLSDFSNEELLILNRLGVNNVEDAPHTVIEGEE